MKMEFDLKVLGNFLSALRTESTQEDWEKLLKEDPKIASIVTRLNLWYIRTKSYRRIVPLNFSDEELEYLASPFLDQIKELERDVEEYRSKRHRDWPDPVLHRICTRGYLETFKWCLNESIFYLPVFNVTLLNIVCKNGHLPLAQWIHKHSAICLDDISDIFSEVCAQGHLEVAQWIYSISKCQKQIVDAFKYACDKGHLNVCQWLWSFDKVPAILDIYFEKACYSGHLNVCQWLWSLGPIDIGNISKNMGLVCDTNNDELILWLVNVCGARPSSN